MSLATWQGNTEGQGSGAEILAPGSGWDQVGLTPVQLELRCMVIDSVAAQTSKLAYGRAIDQLFAVARSRLLTRAVVVELRARR